MSYRLVLYAVPIDTDVAKIRGAAMAIVRTSGEEHSDHRAVDVLGLVAAQNPAALEAEQTSAG